jgi:hypothetical protein
MVWHIGMQRHAPWRSKIGFYSVRSTIIDAWTHEQLFREVHIKARSIKALSPMHARIHFYLFFLT